MFLNKTYSRRQVVVVPYLLTLLAVSRQKKQNYFAVCSVQDANACDFCHLLWPALF